jgi:hypothetical protein
LSGVIERLIEDWLTRANEREYEVPFCQLLMAEGHRVKHRQTHGLTEQGKDVISVDARNRAHAFQLKADDITLARWRREVLPEIHSLTEVPIQRTRSLCESRGAPNHTRDHGRVLCRPVPGKREVGTPPPDV